MDSFNEKFRIEELLIAQVGNWNISLRPQQPTIGSLILSLNRKCSNLSEMHEKEALELRQAIIVIEQILKRAFAPNKINYLALMMVDSQVHFHVIPRYEHVVTINKRLFKDHFWPKPHGLEPLENIGEKELLIIKRYLEG